MRNYEAFLASKRSVATPVGFKVERSNLNPMLFEFQKDIVLWALRCGRSAVFADCGLGKTPIQLEWARQIHEHSSGDVIILAPLAVAQQTQREGAKFGIPVTVCRAQSDVRPGINITNYEMMAHFDPFQFRAIVLDESSILKSFDGKMRKAITGFGHEIHYRLACTATPAPNDYMELGTHAEFMEIMTQPEMLSMFFCHDGANTSKWRLKGHAEVEFWKWVCSWAVAIRKPADLLYDDDGFILPPLNIKQVTVETIAPLEGYLFRVEAQTLEERRAARRDTISERVRACAELVKQSIEPWVIWCNLNAESEALTAAISDAVEVTGTQAHEIKERTMLSFSCGQTRILVTKPLIAGFGMNWQHCNNVIFVGLSDSYEQFYQAIRRCWRFGQTRPVNCYIITADAEGAVVRNIQRKEQQAMIMMDGMVKHMRDSMRQNMGRVARRESNYERDIRQGKTWVAHLGDCLDVSHEIPDDSIHYMLFSPPFASLYTYSDSERDMGNCTDYDQFKEHFGFLVGELYRILMPGRLLSFHCMNLPLTKERDGVIGLRDFSGELIRCFQKVGFIYHSEVVIWKDPVTAMQRTKAIGLLYKQLRKDSTLSRQGIPDYLVTMRKPGENPEPVTKSFDGFPVKKWQNYASPIWMDINPSKTLQRNSVREEEDERHICPLQLEVIGRALELWTNPGDTVFDPFGGIGSGGHVALPMGRRFLMAELKRSYWEQACSNLEWAEKEADRQQELFC